MARRTLPLPAPVAGFSLMEALVTLMLVSFVSLLMFQMLGNYRIAKERVVAQSGIIDRRALFGAWFRDSVRNLYASGVTEFKGDARGFSGFTLDPASGKKGSMTAMAWALRQRQDGSWEMAYSEEETVRWKAQLAEAGSASFGYLDREGKLHETWPPRLGEIEGLPAAVALRRGTGSGPRSLPLVASVHGSLKPVATVYTMEED